MANDTPPDKTGTPAPDVAVPGKTPEDAAQPEPTEPAQLTPVSNISEKQIVEVIERIIVDAHADAEFWVPYLRRTGLTNLNQLLAAMHTMMGKIYLASFDWDAASRPAIKDLAVRLVLDPTGDLKIQPQQLKWERNDNAWEFQRRALPLPPMGKPTAVAEPHFVAILDAIMAHPRDLDGLRRVICEVTPPELLPPPPTTPAAGKVAPLIVGKDKILEELDLLDEKWPWLLKLSRDTNGPIQVKRGSRNAVADRDTLRIWFKTVTENYGAKQAAKKARELEAKTTYKYGRNGEVVPAISGHIVKPRKPH